MIDRRPLVSTGALASFFVKLCHLLVKCKLFGSWRDVGGWFEVEVARLTLIDYRDGHFDLTELEWLILTRLIVPARIIQSLLQPEFLQLGHFIRPQGRTCKRHRLTAHILRRGMVIVVYLELSFRSHHRFVALVEILCRLVRFEPLRIP